MSITITLGEQSENHTGMIKQGNGLSDSGFNKNDLENIIMKLAEKNIESELYSLNSYLENDDKISTDPAYVLIIRNGVNKISNIDSKQMFSEQLTYEWDKKYWDNRRSKVLNKKARYNVCYGKYASQPDYENKKGTIISYDDIPLLNKWIKDISEIIGIKAQNLEAEGNYYYDPNKCGIGYHGDSERKKVIACCLGESKPLHWRWYYKSKQIGDDIKFELNCGDIYIMSEKASGFDWKFRNKKTLRHASGKKYVK